MPSTSYPTSQAPHYDPRWFIWTIVFLVVTGVSLVGYMTLSDNGASDSDIVVVHRTTTQKTPTKTPLKTSTTTKK